MRPFVSYFHLGSMHYRQQVSKQGAHTLVSHCSAAPRSHGLREEIPLPWLPCGRTLGEFAAADLRVLLRVLLLVLDRGKKSRLASSILVSCSTRYSLTIGYLKWLFPIQITKKYSIVVVLLSMCWLHTSQEPTKKASPPLHLVSTPVVHGQQSNSVKVWPQRLTNAIASLDKSVQFCLCPICRYFIYVSAVQCCFGSNKQTWVIVADTLYLVKNVALILKNTQQNQSDIQLKTTKNYVSLSK